MEPESRRLKQRRLEIVTFMLDNWPDMSAEVRDWMIDEQNKLFDALDDNG